VQSYSYKFDQGDSFHRSFHVYLLTKFFTRKCFHGAVCSQKQSFSDYMYLYVDDKCTFIQLTLTGIHMYVDCEPCFEAL
jgi:hypothetical protein